MMNKYKKRIHRNKTCQINYTEDACLSLVGTFPNKTKKLQSLKQYGRLNKLFVTEQTLLTTRLAYHFTELEAVHWLWLWCPVTRNAMRHIINIPELETLDIFELHPLGRLKNFAQARTLKTLRCCCAHEFSEADILEIARLPVLQELSMQHSQITQRALQALLHIPTLVHLDLEATIFNDEMAALLAESNTIQHLDIGATKLTTQGLRKIATMTQLRSLDIWATHITEDDLDLLAHLPNLEYLSIGGYDEQEVLTAKGVLPRLQAIPSLKRIWLDGITLTNDEKHTLQQRYDSVRN